MICSIMGQGWQESPRLLTWCCTLGAATIRENSLGAGSDLGSSGEESDEVLVEVEESSKGHFSSGHTPEVTAPSAQE